MKKEDKIPVLSPARLTCIDLRKSQLAHIFTSLFFLYCRNVIMDVSPVILNGHRYGTRYKDRNTSFQPRVPCSKGTYVMVM